METNEILLSLLTLFDLALLGGFLWCRKELKGYRRMVRVMTADSRAVPTDPELIEEWVRERDSYGHNSPKWVAYNNRLREFGLAKGADGR